MFRVRLVLLSACVCAVVLTHSSPTLAQASAASELAQGRAALAHNDPRAAVDHLQKALALGAPDNTAIRLNVLESLGQATYWLERYPAALAAYQEAYRLADNPAVRTRIAPKLARCLSLMDRPREAYGLMSLIEPKSYESAIETARAALLLGWDGRAAAVLLDMPADVVPGQTGIWLDREYIKQKDELDFRLSDKWRLDTGYTSDSDGLRTRLLAFGYSFNSVAHVGPRRPTGAAWDLALQTELLDDKTSATSVTEVSGAAHVYFNEDLKSTLQLGAGHGGDWDYLTGAMRLLYRSQDQWGWRVDATREAIKTPQALAAHVAVTSASLGADYRFGQSLILATSVFGQHFSDGNDRRGIVLQVDTVPYALTDVGASVGLQFFARYFENDTIPAAGYFNPEKFHEELINIVWKQRLSPDWMLQFSLGPGLQTINDSTSGTLGGAAQLIGKISKHARLNFTVGHGDSSAYSSTGEGYRRSYAYLSLVIPHK